MAEKRMKKGTVTVIVLLVLIIPLLIAALVLQSNMDSDLTRGTVEQIRLTMNGKETKIPAEEFDFFLSVATGGEEVDHAAHDLSEYRSAVLVFCKPRNELSYTLYLSDSVRDCLYADPEGRLFLIPSETAAELLAHPQITAHALSFADRPKVTIFSEGAARVEGDWYFSKTDSTTSHETVSETAERRVTLPQGQSLKPEFSIAPDYCAVRLFGAQGELMYSGTLSDLPILTLTEDTFLTLVLTCDWYEKDEISYHGRLEYTFALFYDVPTLCVLENSQAAVGDHFTVIVSHSSSSSLAVIATFSSQKVTPVKSGNSWIVTVPVPEGTPLGNYEILLMGSDVEKTFPVTILEKETPSETEEV